MERAGEYNLAIQIGPRGFYARVWLVTSPSPSSNSLTIEVAQEVREAPSEFQLAIEKGLDAAWERSRRVGSAIRGLLVREVHLHYMAVDSTPMCVAYAAAGALLKALGLERLLPQFEPDKTFEEMLGRFGEDFPCISTQAP